MRRLPRSLQQTFQVVCKTCQLGARQHTRHYPFDSGNIHGRRGRELAPALVSEYRVGASPVIRIRLARDKSRPNHIVNQPAHPRATEAIARLLLTNTGNRLTTAANAGTAPPRMNSHPRVGIM